MKKNQLMAYAVGSMIGLFVYEVIDEVGLIESAKNTIMGLIR